VFGFFSSVEKQMRANAANWLELAEKVYHYRRDEISATDRAALQQQMESLRALLRERADASKLKLGIESLEGVLRRTGGKIYPKSTVQEYVEFFLVAAIVILGIRTYFVQPFKIPTNSMWPSYNGMTAEVYRNPNEAPGPMAKVMRVVLFGAQHKELVAPETGKITVPIGEYNNTIHLPFERKPGRKWLVFPTIVRVYTLFVNERPVHLEVPEDFDFDQAFKDFLGLPTDQLLAKVRGSRPVESNSSYHWVTLDQPAEQGKVFLSFDVMTGDQLFVDRLSYHFVQPRPGQGFVFKTGNIKGIGHDQYYIKRLVGVPGDTIEIKEPVLYRNGKPITGSKAFEANALRQGKYRGYFNPDPRFGGINLLPGEPFKVDNAGFLALGDNSGNSADGRYWGEVPKKDVIGRPLWIYYPFTSRWGPAP
jgi:signal peptidase I